MMWSNVLSYGEHNQEYTLYKKSTLEMANSVVMVEEIQDSFIISLLSK